MEEEAAVRADLAEPKRLPESDDALAGFLSAVASEDPAPARQARVLNRMKHPEQPRARWMLPVSVLSAAATALFILLQVPSTPDVPSVATTAPTSLALTLPSGSDLRVLRHNWTTSGPVLALGDGLQVVVSNEGRAQVKGVGDLILGQIGTTLKLVQADDHGVRLELASGRVSVHAEKRSRAAPLIIQAQGVEVEVVGTIFTVETTPSGPHVYVREGIVAVRSDGKTTLVTANQTWPATEPMPAWADDAMAILDGQPHIKVDAEPVEPPHTVVATADATKKSVKHHPKKAAKPVVEAAQPAMVVPLPAPPTGTHQ